MHAAAMCDAALRGGTAEATELPLLDASVSALEEDEEREEEVETSAATPVHIGEAPLADTTLQLVPGDEAAARAQASQALLSLRELTDADDHASRIAAGLVTPPRAARGRHGGTYVLLTPRP